MELQLATKEKITWCAGCPNNAILVAFRQAITDLVGSGAITLENVVAGAGVGCHGKISDYLNMNTFDSLHGRVVPSMTGIKIANPALTVVAFSGDGDSLSEGFTHVIHAAERNSDINLFIHNNQVFALTTGQSTATSPLGHKGPSRPQGSIEHPIDPVAVMLSAGATFVARTYAGDIAKTKEVMKAAINHKGFSFVDIIQPCITFFDTRDHFKDHIVWLPEEHNAGDLQTALRAAHRDDDMTPAGIFYRVDRPTYESLL